MLTRTIDILKSSEVFDQILVSTDSDQIAEVASKSTGIEVSRRMPSLANDDANTVDVISSVLEKGGFSDSANVCCVYAPNPFLQISAVQLGLSEIQAKKDVDYVTPVTSYPFPIQRSLKFDSSGVLLSMAEPQYLLRHSQSLEPRFHETAQFWWATAATWLARKPMQVNVVGIYTPRWMTQDIDTAEDWQQAEIRWQILKLNPQMRDYKFSKSNILNINRFEE